MATSKSRQIEDIRTRVLDQPTLRGTLGWGSTRTYTLPEALADMRVLLDALDKKC